MKYTLWKKYTFEEEDRLPSSLEIEICDSEAAPKDFNPQQVVETYKGYYFFEDKKDDLCPSGIRRSSKWAEEKVLNLMDKKNRNQWNALSVKQILAWKTGKINQRITQENQRFDYAKGWREDELSIQLPYQSPMDRDVFQRLSDIVIELHKEYNEDKKNENEVWEELVECANNNQIAGLGTVYLITLLFFITNGDCPIYDRFAMASLASFVLNEQEIKIPDGSVIRGCSLPDRRNAKTILLDSNSIYKKYRQLLEYFFDNQWKTNRDIDRALWVYGHRFNVVG